MNSTLKNFLSFNAKLVAGALFMSTVACSPKTTVPKKTDTNQTNKKIMQTEKSTVCEVFTVENPDEAEISQMFADMNMRRQAGDFGPGEYTAFDYWQQLYSVAPGFDIRVYTDGSAIYRELAAKAKEDGNDAKFDEYGQKALDLLDKGEECYPQYAGKFNPSRAYIYELLYPEKHETILELYTADLGANTDPYSLISIARYAMYMGYVEKLSYPETKRIVSKAKAISLAKKGNETYDYAAQQIEAIENQYASWVYEMENPQASQETPVVTETETTTGQTQEVSAEAQAAYEKATKASEAYNNMITAVGSKDYSTAARELNTYLANEADAGRKYTAAMYLGSNLYSESKFPEAREAFRKAAQADPSKGDPHYYIGMMYLSSGPLCGPGTGFDSQRVLWPAFDKLDLAMTKDLSQELRDSVTSTKQEYKAFFPAAHQLKAEGLTNGSTYTVPCWINESTVVRQKQ